MVLFNNKNECCGCSACSSVCPESAIQMLPDKEGFLYPVIDSTRCINCGLCKKTCAFQNNNDSDKNPKNAEFYAVKHKNPDEILKSQSGGMFAVISDYILENNGIVYGAGFEDHFRVVHKIAINKEQRNEFRYSKYVQSDVNGTFSRVKKDLQNGHLVLYSGTPCQIAGLVAFLKDINTEKLFVCDIICYGVPSPFIWRDYLKYIEKRYQDKVVEVYFRDKHIGWSSYCESFVFSKSKKKISRNTYTGLYFGNLMIRPSCSICKFTKLQRPSDMTIGDYWGVERISADFNSGNSGVSLVIVNTDNGKKLFDVVKSKIDYLESNAKNCSQPRLEHPTEFSVARNEFWNDYYKHGFIYIGKKYGDLGFKSFIIIKINKIKRFLLPIMSIKKTIA
jgi:coenzyme F420-reducing hydrogenase beta subunit